MDKCFLIWSFNSKFHVKPSSKCKNILIVCSLLIYFGDAITFVNLHKYETFQLFKHLHIWMSSRFVISESTRCTLCSPGTADLGWSHCPVHYKSGIPEIKIISLKSLWILNLAQTPGNFPYIPLQWGNRKIWWKW